MRIKNFVVSQDSYVLNDIWSTKKVGTDRAFLFLWRRAGLPTDLLQTEKKFLNESYAHHGIT
jgi:hypothetical protein